MKTTFPRLSETSGELLELRFCGLDPERFIDPVWSISLGWEDDDPLVGDVLGGFGMLESEGSRLKVGIGRFREVLGNGLGTPAFPLPRFVGAGMLSPPPPLFPGPLPLPGL